jgi:phytoene desaturase
MKTEGNLSKKIIVIGSGFGGLGVAARLAAHGHDVQLFEKRDKLGGRAYTYEINGFKFDGGPTVITAPFMIDDIFQAAGRNREDYLKFVPCDPFYKIFDHQGKGFSYNNDQAFVQKEIERFNPKDKEGYLRFLAATKPIFEKGFVELADKPFLHISDMFKVAPDLVRLQSYKSVYGFTAQYVENEFLRQVLSFHPLLVGGNPFDAPSIYAMINYLMDHWGVWYAIGGTGAIVEALGKLFVELGGKVQLNTEVDEILVEGRKATGVRLKNGEIYKADIVISNADVAWTYMNMIPNKARRINKDIRYRNMRYSMSLFVIYFGTKRQYKDCGLVHHNIILSQRFRALLDDIFRRKIIADDFSLYLHMPTYTDPSIAPDGTESFYVLSPVPHLDAADVDWNTFAPIYKERILTFLEDNYLPELRENIIAETYIDPLHFQNTLNSYKGAAFSLEPVMTQSAWFRPHNRSEDFDNLYFVGAGTHPGGGMPGVLSSSIIVENLIQDSL